MWIEILKKLETEHYDPKSSIQLIFYLVNYRYSR